MLGMEDFWVGFAYLLCIVCSLVCVVYGAVNWNKGDEPLEQDDENWAATEDKLEEDL